VYKYLRGQTCSILLHTLMVGHSQTCPAWLADECCDPGFNLLDSDAECPGTAAIATSSCAGTQVCCSEPGIVANVYVAAPPPNTSDKCCINGFSLLDSAAECPGTAAIATSSCGGTQVCCSISRIVVPAPILSRRLLGTSWGELRAVGRQGRPRHQRKRGVVSWFNQVWW
jgi:hypothetical protein